MITYEEAREELEHILQQLQEEVVPIDELKEKTVRAKELIAYCRKKLRTTQEELDALFDEE